MDVGASSQSLLNEIFSVEKKFREKISNSSTDFSEIFIKLQEIGHRFETFPAHCHQLYGPLELLLLTYLDFLDFDQFAEVAIEANQWGNNIFLRTILVMYTDLGPEYFTDSYLERPDQSVSRLLKRLASSNRIIDSFNVEKTMKISLQTTCQSLLILCLRVISHHSSAMIEVELEKYQDKLILPMISYLEKYLEETKNLTITERTVSELFSFFSLVACYRIQIVPLLIKWNFLSICCKVLSCCSYPIRIYEHALTMIYGLICHDEGHKALVDSNGVPLMVEFCQFCNQNLLFVVNKTERKNIVPLTIAIYVTINDTTGFERFERFINMGQTFNYPLNSYSPYLEIIIESNTENIFIPSSILFPVCQYLLNLFRVSWYHECLSRLNPTSTIEIINTFFRRHWSLFYSFDIASYNLTLMANIIWSLSFHSKFSTCAEYFLQEIEKRSLTSINQIAKYYYPRHVVSFRRAIDGIRENLRTKVMDSATSISTIHRSSISLMISYAHDDYKILLPILNILLTIPQLSIHIDVQHQTFLWHEIATAIDQADAVLSFQSSEYYLDRSCRQEFVYAKKKPMIPIELNANFPKDGWLTTSFRPLQCDDKSSNEIVDEILERLNKIFSMEIPLISKSEKSTDVRLWNADDVRQWFVKKNLSLEIVEFYQFLNGNELLLYAQAMLKYGWSKEYERIKNRISSEGTLPVHQFYKFSNALERILN